MKNEIQLSSGIDIFLTALNQNMTYEGLLEGLPTKERNKDIVNSSIEMAKNKWNITPFLITPIETPISMNRKYPFGTPAYIPGITCLALFNSFVSYHDHTELSIVWFQSSFALPIEETALSQIRLIDWKKHAQIYQY